MYLPASCNFGTRKGAPDIGFQEWGCGSCLGHLDALFVFDLAFAFGVVGKAETGHGEDGTHALRNCGQPMEETEEFIASILTLKALASEFASSKFAVITSTYVLKRQSFRTVATNVAGGTTDLL